MCFCVCSSFGWGWHFFLPSTLNCIGELFFFQQSVPAAVTYCFPNKTVLPGNNSFFTFVWVVKVLQIAAYHGSLFFHICFCLIQSAVSFLLLQNQIHNTSSSFSFKVQSLTNFIFTFFGFHVVLFLVVQQSFFFQLSKHLKKGTSVVSCDISFQR